MKRGEIYFIHPHHTVGSEVAKGRPAVIVSDDALNATSDVIEVVFLTTKPKKELPCHAEIHATGTASTALCEQINSVSKLRVGAYFGRCTEEEMEGIDRALMRSLDLMLRTTKKEELADARKHDAVNHPSHYTDGRIEVIDYIEDKHLGYHLGNAVKYISRAGKKDLAKTIEDLKKAVWYIAREIERQEAEEEALKKPAWHVAREIERQEAEG